MFSLLGLAVSDSLYYNIYCIYSAPAYRVRENNKKYQFRCHLHLCACVFFHLAARHGEGANPFLSLHHFFHTPV